MILPRNAESRHYRTFFAYNAARYLPAALESVIAQSFDDWRILLVDDGSTDNTAEVVAPFIDRLGPKLGSNIKRRRTAGYLPLETQRFATPPRSFWHCSTLMTSGCPAGCPNH